ncbi:MAG: S-layer protein [Candidatus Aenigmarchaeota archaeon]|nr:S-layer protein [Candidatus Aenigmarchaeota archaeon]
MQIRKIASTAVGALLAGATFAVPALGATLDGLPAPFVSGSAANFVVVVGAGAATADVIGAVDIAARFGGETVSTGSAEKKQGQKDAYLGKAITSQFPTRQTSNDIGILTSKATISIGSDTYDTHDEIVLASTSPTLNTSLNSNQKDYGTETVLEVQQGAIGYYYLFDTKVNITKSVTSTTPLVISFLGQQMTITASADATTITARAGTKLSLKAGESATVENKLVKLVQTSDTSALVDVGGTQDTVGNGNTKTINGLQVKVDSVFNDQGTVNDFAVIIVGTNAEKSYTHGDGFISPCSSANGDSACTKDTADWTWVLNGLASNTKGDTSAGGGPTIGIQNRFTKASSSKSPIKLGQAYFLPYDFAKVEMTSAKYTDYMKLDVFPDTLDLNTTAIGNPRTLGTAEKAIVMTSDVDDTIALEDQSGAAGNAWFQSDLTADTTSKKLAFVYSNLNDTIDVWYYDKNGKPNYAGNLSVNNTGTAAVNNFAHIEYKDTRGTGGVQLGLNASNTSLTSGDLWLVLQDQDSNVGGATHDDIWISLGFTGTRGLTGLTASTQGLDRLGVTKSSAEDRDVLYGANVGGSAQQIGKRDVDQMTSYGIKVEKPSSTTASDHATLSIPAGPQQIRVTIGAKDAASATGTRTGQIKTSVSKLDTEVATPASEKNLVLVGGPCANRLVAQLADAGKYAWKCDDLGKLPAGAGYSIEMVNDAFATGQVALVVSGVSAADTRAAAARVQTFDTDGLKGASVRTGVLATA